MALLEVKELRTSFFTDAGEVKAVDGISFKIKRGTTMGLVGESGCGKSTVGRTILRLQEKTDGEVYFDGQEIFSLSDAELRAMRSDLRAMRSASGEPFNLVELPLPDAIYDDEGNRLPATYANFLIVNNGVLVPVYNQPKKDRLACQIIRVAFPGHEIVPVDCRALIQQHGSLHCATMQFPVINF